MRVLRELISMFLILILVLLAGLLPIIIPLAYDQIFVKGLGGAPPKGPENFLVMMPLFCLITVPLSIIFDVILIVGWTVEGLAGLRKTGGKVVHGVRLSEKDLNYNKYTD